MIENNFKLKAYRFLLGYLGGYIVVLISIIILFLLSPLFFWSFEPFINVFKDVDMLEIAKTGNGIGIILGVANALTKK